MPNALTSRLTALRDQLAMVGLDGFIIGREDMYQGEEVPPGDERLAYISGFTGSAGLAVVTQKWAVLFSDGRYSLQMRAQTDAGDWQCCTMPDVGLNDWLAEHAVTDLTFGVDGRLVTMTGFDRFCDAIERAGGYLTVVDDNPIDVIWQDQPKMPPSCAWRMDDNIAGKTVAEKLAMLDQKLDEQQSDAILLSRVDAVNWLVNMRGSDLPCTPVNLCFAFFHRNHGLTLLGEAARLAPIMSPSINVAPLAELAQLLAPLAGQSLLIEPASLPKSLAKIVKDSAVTVIEADCPLTSLKARKNQVEIDGFRKAHLLDGVAMVEFLTWLDGITPADYSETQIVNQLHGFRAKHAAFLAPSFATIAGAGPNGAIVHYRAVAGADRQLVDGDILLLDSGGHYQTGTTDITRTILIGTTPAPAAVAEAYTHVLRGHIALAMACFETGATGQQLDGIARAPLWAAGLQFAHGTGHGVGHVLSVHEGPASISKRGGVAIEAGMVLSNEPGYYCTDHFGIRLENLIVARPADDAGFLCFETLTLCPFDRRLILPELLSPTETHWLNAYHEGVSQALMPHLSTDCQQWLAAAAAPL